MGGAAAVIASAVVSSISAGYSSKRARQTAGRAEASYNRKVNEAEALRKNREEVARTQATEYRKKQAERRTAAVAGSPSGSIRTAPLGLPGGGSAYPKRTLLGG